MKPARIIPLLLLTLALIAPRMASAQKVDTLFISPDCGGDLGWDFGYLNWDNEYVNQIVLTLDPADSIGFAGATETGPNVRVWDNYVDSLGDSLVFTPLNGGGIAPGINDTGFYFLLGGLGGTQFPFDRFDHPITIHFTTLAGGTVVSQRNIVLIPTLFQGNCTFDSVGGTVSADGCSPQFNLHVFNNNGLQQPISNMKFEIVGSTAGSMRPSEIKPPTGWGVDSVTQSAAYFSTPCGSSYQIPYESNLSGFLVTIRANPNVNSFSFVWTAYSCGAIIDRDTARNLPVTPQECSDTAYTDSLVFVNTGECGFAVNAKNYHSGDGNDTVSTVTSWNLIITTPGVTWASATNPPQAITGTWQNSGVGTDTLHFYERPIYMIDPQYAQPGGTIWTPSATIYNPNQVENVTVQWTDSTGTTASTFLSSGTTTISCSNSKPDTSWIEEGSDCSYTLIVRNQHTHPTSSINAISLQMPVASGTFPAGASCYSASNGWSASAPGNNSLRFTNLSGTSGYLRTGSYDTIHFCVDPAQINTFWTLSWTPIDSANRNETPAYQLTVPGCAPALVCDSIRHMIDTTSCSDTIVVLNLRQGGAEIDSVVVTPSGGWSIASAIPPILWAQSILPGGSSVVFTGSLTPGLSDRFFVEYNTGGSKSSSVQVSTYSNGSTCPKTQTLSCSTLGVSPSSVPQSLGVSVVPNPMNQEAQIVLTTGTFDRVQMTLLDVLGRSVKTVANGTLSAGDHDYTLDVSQLPMGTYYLRVVASGATLTKKLVVTH